MRPDEGMDGVITKRSVWVPNCAQCVSGGRSLVKVFGQRWRTRRARLETTSRNSMEIGALPGVHMLIQPYCKLRHRGLH